MTEKLTLTDIKKAMALIKENSPPDKWIETEHAMVQINCFGDPITIILKKGAQELFKQYIKEIIRPEQDISLKLGAVGEFCGVPIFTTKHIKDITK